MINIALVGIGRIGLVHVHTIKTKLSSEVNLSLFVDSMSKDLENKAKEYNTKYSRSFDECLNDKTIDAVLLCTPTNTHTESCIKALKSGKHVFCEKPIATNIEDHLKVIEASKKSDKKLMVGFNRRFDHNYKNIKERIDTGEIGKVQMIKLTNYDSPFPNVEFLKTSGGIYLDLCIHDLDLISFLTDKNGDEPVELFTWGSAFLMPELAEFGDVDTAIVSVKMKSGAIANINTTRFANYGYDQRAEVLGTKGSLESRNDTPTNVILQNERGVIGDKPFYTFLDRYENAYAEEIKQFVESIINDKDVPVNAQDCLPALKMALAANISLKENRIVKIDEIK